MTPPQNRKKSSSAVQQQQQQPHLNFATFEPQRHHQYQHQQQQHSVPQSDEPIAKRLRTAQPHQDQLLNSATTFVAVNHHHHHHHQNQQQQQQQYHIQQQLQQQLLQQSYYISQQQPTALNAQPYSNVTPVYSSVPYSSSITGSPNLVSFVANSGTAQNSTATNKIDSANFETYQPQQQQQEQQHLLQTVNSNRSSSNHPPQHLLQKSSQQQLYNNLNHHPQQSGPQLAPQKDMYFFKNNENSSDFSKKRARQFFNAYSSSSEPELIDPDGIEKLCADLQLKTDDPLVLVLSWKLKAKVMGMYTYAEWLEGMAELKCDTLAKLRNKLGYLQSCLNDPAQFKIIYRYSFEFAKENDQRCLDMTVARQMLGILLAPRWRLFPLFNEFLSTVRYRVLNKDQYYNVLDFSRSVDDDLLNYDEESAWPVIMDEFVEYCREVKGFPGPSAADAKTRLPSSGQQQLQSMSIDSNSGGSGSGRSGDFYESRRESR